MIASREGWEEPPVLDVSNIKTHITSQYKRVEWYLAILKRYRGCDYRYILIDGHIRKCPKSELPYKIHKGTTHEICGDDVIVWLSTSSTKAHPTPPYEVAKKCGGKVDYESSTFPTRKPLRFKRTQIALPSDDVYKLGFASHAAAKMWVGYEDALQEYIDIHNCEYTRRTGNVVRLGKCNPTNEDSDEESSIDNPLRHSNAPWWITYTKCVINSHRAALLRKEMMRNEEGWYWRNPVFTSTHPKWIFKNYGYVWTASLGIKLAVRLGTNSVGVKMSDVCAPVTSDKYTPEKARAYLSENKIDIVVS